MAHVNTPPTDDRSESACAVDNRAAWVAILAFFATLFGADFALRRSRLGRTLAQESWYITRPDLYSNDPEGADILGLGDSRMGNAFNPFVTEQIIEMERGERLRVWDGGLPGAPPMAHLAWIQRALSHRHRPRMVLLAISPYMFSSRITRAPSRESLTTIFRLQDAPALVRAASNAEDVFTAFHAALFLSERVRPRLIEVFTRFTGLNPPASPGNQGFEDHPSADRATQNARAIGRVRGYREELTRPAARFGSEQQGYFIESLRTLRAHGIQTVVLDSLCASQMDAILGPESIYPEHIAWVRAQSRRFGATFVDSRHPPTMDDGDFSDADHVSTQGSERYSRWLAHEYIVPLLGGRRNLPPTDCRTVYDFEGPTLDGWTLDGPAVQNAMSDGARNGQRTVMGFEGQRLFNTYQDAYADSSVGVATSPVFTVDSREIRFRVGGGSSAQIAVELRVDGRVVRSAHGLDSEILHAVVWNVTQWRGRSAVLRIRDGATGAWGHILVDSVAMCP